LDSKCVSEISLLFESLDLLLFTVKTSKYWMDTHNRKAFFLEFAKSKNFDPLLPENWYAISRKEILQFKVHPKLWDKGQPVVVAVVVAVVVVVV
jgi:hypothetical protein